jgi:Domain of unknown function (DUF4272)
MVVDLKTAGLWLDVELEERRLLLSDQISAQQRIDSSWLGESIASLLWALQMITELPHYDQEMDPALTGRLRSAPIRELVRQAKLRPKEQIEKQREAAELWHWRARTRELLALENSDGQSVRGPTIQAFNWLCGFSPTGRWADTYTDT